jgi:hypothetical protein
MVALGLLFAAAFGAFAVMVATEALRAKGPGPAALAAAVALGLLAIALYGAKLAWRGARGHSSPRQFARLAAWAERHLLALALVYAAAVVAVLVTTIAKQGPSGLVRLQRGYGDMGDTLGWWAVLGLVAGPFQLALHEAGHAVAGYLAGLDVRSVQIGPVRASRETGRWRLAWRPIGTFGVGGLVVAAPVGDRLRAPRLALFHAGGVLANLAGAAAAWAVVRAHPRPETAPAALGLAFLVGFAWTGAFGLLNLLPWGAGPFQSDGARIAAALRARR